MPQEIQQQVLDALNGLAEGLKTTSEHVYGILVRQAFIDSIIGVLTIVFLLIITPIVLYYAKKLYFFFKKESDNPDTYDTSGYEAGMAITVIASLLFIFVVCMRVFSLISPITTGFLNPEYQATERITSLVGNLQP